MIISRSIHIAALFHSFLWLSSIPLLLITKFLIMKCLSCFVSLRTCMQWHLRLDRNRGPIVPLPAFLVLVVVHSLSHVQLFVTPWTAAHQVSFLVLHYLAEFAQTHVHWLSDAIQSSRPLLPPSPPVLNLSQHQGLFQWVGSLHQMDKILELQLQHQSFQWIFRVDFL